MSLIMCNICLLCVAVALYIGISQYILGEPHESVIIIIITKVHTMY